MVEFGVINGRGQISTETSMTFEPDRRHRGRPPTPRSPVNARKEHQMSPRPRITILLYISEKHKINHSTQPYLFPKNNNAFLFRKSSYLCEKSKRFHPSIGNGINLSRVRIFPWYPGSAWVPIPEALPPIRSDDILYRQLCTSLQRRSPHRCMKGRWCVSRAVGRSRRGVQGTPAEPARQHSRPEAGNEKKRPGLKTRAFCPESTALSPPYPTAFAPA